MRAIHSKWKPCLLLFLATTLNYLDRQTLGILAPLMQQELNWRWAFVLIGSFGLLRIVLWAIMTRNPAHESVWLPDTRMIASQTRFQGYGEILRTAQFWRVFVVAVLVNPRLYFFLNWLPEYFSQQWDVPPARLKGILTLIFPGLDLGYLFCGGGILGITRRGWRLASARQMVFATGTVLLSLTALVPFAVDLNMAVVLLVLANIGAGCWIAMYLTMAQEVSATNVSTAAGLLGGSGSLAGAFGMCAVDKVTHETSSFAVPLACIALAALLACVAGSHVVRHTKESQTFLRA